MVVSNSDEVPHMAAVAKSTNAASPSLDWSSEGVEKVEGLVAALWTWFGQ
jgi:hypothetical protein